MATVATLGQAEARLLELRPALLVWNHRHRYSACSHCFPRYIGKDVDWKPAEQLQLEQVPHTGITSHWRTT